MKLKWTGSLAAIVTLMLSVAVAAPRNKTTIQTYQPVTVGTVVLQPGEYTVEWNGVGPNVQVSFSQQGQWVATVPATLQAAQNPYDSFTTDAQPSGMHLLVEIDTRTLSLRFAPSGNSAGQ